MVIGLLEAVHHYLYTTRQPRQRLMILQAAGNTRVQLCPAEAAGTRTFQSSHTSVGGHLNGGWQLDAVVHPLTVADTARLAALNSLLHQEAEDVAGILCACTVPL